LKAIETKLDALLLSDGVTNASFTQVLVSLKGEFRTVIDEFSSGVAKGEVTDADNVRDRIAAAIEKAKNVDTVPTYERPKIRLFVGVFTGINDAGRTEDQSPEQKLRYDYRRRRHVLRDTWFPNSVEERERLEREKGIVVRFIVGNSKDPDEQKLLAEEDATHHDFLRLPITESYYGLTNKTKTFFAAALSMYDPDWVVKVDDDVYYMVERTLLAMKQWDKMGATYIGCMKHGHVWKTEDSRWYEPQHLLFGDDYYLHAYGSIYAMHKTVVENVILRNFHTLRIFANEDVTVGSWMLGQNVTHFEDMRLCATKCSSAAIGILRNECAGLCNPLKDLYIVHHAKHCQGAAKDPLPYLPSYPEHTDFEKMRV